MRSSREGKSRLFPALLKHWRSARGMSQLDLGLAADVSSRHVSFLETGRAQPSREMVLRLGATLEVPLRDQNSMLVAAGFPEEFREPSVDGELDPAIADALDRMLACQEPYPLIVTNRRYDLLLSNGAAQRLLGKFVAEPSALVPPVNGFRVVFDPRLIRPYVVDWEKTARLMLSRLHREALSQPGDDELSDLARSLMEYPDVPESWRQPDFSLPSEPTLTIRLARDDFELAFLTTLTVFNAPQNVTLDELRIEAYFPLDEKTRATCERLAAKD